MKKFYFILVGIIFMPTYLFSQASNWIYATMKADDAHSLKVGNPNNVEILSSSNGLSAVYINSEITHQLKQNGNLHGPGYIFRSSAQTALNSIQNTPQNNASVLDFTITEDYFVSQCIGMVIEENIADVILELEDYGTRFHDTSTGVQASLDIKDLWQSMAVGANRTDITVEEFNHDFTDQKSVIITIPGSEFPDEIVVIGGHLDSGDYWNPDDAPGADDNASGIATLTETFRILLENDFQPLRTVQIMGYAAEEIGLYGSADIAENYSFDDKDVLAVAQFDMTNYKGSTYDIALISDPEYTSSDLNLYLIELMEHYNASGEHAITYGTSYCGYGCSDHVSWTENGYLAAFPFEAAFEDSNPHVHSTNDTFETMDNDASHSMKFVKLALEFVIEIAKVGTLGINDQFVPEVSIVVQNRNLVYDFNNLSGKLSSLDIFDSSARKLISKNNLNIKGDVSLSNFPNGIYVAVFKDQNGKTYSKKFLLK